MVLEQFEIEEIFSVARENDFNPLNFIIILIFTVKCCLTLLEEKLGTNP